MNGVDESQLDSQLVTHSVSDVAPLPVGKRIRALDVLRGVAVAGILFANVLVFFGLTFMPPDRAAALPSVAADNVALFLEHVFCRRQVLLVVLFAVWHRFRR